MRSRGPLRVSGSARLVRRGSGRRAGVESRERIPGMLILARFHVERVARFVTTTSPGDARRRPFTPMLMLTAPASWKWTAPHRDKDMAYVSGTTASSCCGASRGQTCFTWNTAVVQRWPRCSWWRDGWRSAPVLARGWSRWRTAGARQGSGCPSVVARRFTHVDQVRRVVLDTHELGPWVVTVTRAWPGLRTVHRETGDSTMHTDRRGCAGPGGLGAGHADRRASEGHGVACVCLARRFSVADQAKGAGCVVVAATQGCGWTRAGGSYLLVARI